MNPLKIEPEERRFVIFGCNDSKKGDTAYFAWLAAHLNRPDVARAFYQYLRDDVDVSRFLPFQAHRPRTEAYSAMQQHNIPLFYKFLSSKIIRDLSNPTGPEPDIMATAFFQEMKTWLGDGGYAALKYSLTAFGREAGNLIARLTAVDGNQGIFTKRDIPRGKQYSVDWVQLRTYLQSAQLFDPYAAG